MSIISVLIMIYEKLRPLRKFYPECMLSSLNMADPACAVQFVPCEGEHECYVNCAIWALSLAACMCSHKWSIEQPRVIKDMHHWIFVSVIGLQWAARRRQHSGSGRALMRADRRDRKKMSQQRCENKQLHMRNPSSERLLSDSGTFNHL